MICLIMFHTRKYIHMLVIKAVSSSFYTHSHIILPSILSRHIRPKNERRKNFFHFQVFCTLNLLGSFLLRLELMNTETLEVRHWKGQSHKKRVRSLLHLLEESHQSIINTHFESYMKKKQNSILWNHWEFGG